MAAGGDEAQTLVHCPIRGELSAPALAKDGLTPTEEARRVDFLYFLLEDRGYPEDNIKVETVVLKGIGHDGKKSLRADVVVFDAAHESYGDLELDDLLSHATLVAEIKRDSSSRGKGISRQLEPALKLLPNVDALGVYWDDQHRDLLIKRLVPGDPPSIEVVTDSIANLPPWGQGYSAKPISVESLTVPRNLVAVLTELANVMRSHGINDEHVRYKETVKLLLARYVDERQARSSDDGILRLQVHSGSDPEFPKRVASVYEDSARRYSHAKTLFEPYERPGVEEAVLRKLVASIQGFDFSSASNETMQQVFMSFVPAVFKKSLSQYFTPVSLVEAVVSMVQIGPTDKVVDPAMGTADFLTATMNERRGDDDIDKRVFGIDSDQKAFDLAVVNMILSRDGQSGLFCEDSIRNPGRWHEEMDIALCNPPFGSKTVESDKDTLSAYALGHSWECDANGEWSQTDEVLDKQQLGILFLERCWMLLKEGGRVGLIWPEGYLSTAAYGWLRTWLLRNFKVLGLVELPRRIFTKSSADLRSNILILEKADPSRRQKNYPIFAGLVRNVGYKLGGDFAQQPRREAETGLEIRDDDNEIVLDSDFQAVVNSFIESRTSRQRNWKGARLADVTSHGDLDLKPRRLVPNALNNTRQIKSGKFEKLGDIALVVEETVDLLGEELGAAKLVRPIEGSHIRAVEGIALPGFPERCWELAERKAQGVCRAQKFDIIVGLVRPERRNIGVLLTDDKNTVVVRDGAAIVRAISEEYPIGWLFTALRAEQTRIQFWTESGGTSYGKLSLDQMKETLVPIPTPATRSRMHKAALTWMDLISAASKSWANIGTVADRRPILNSPLIGLVD